MTHGTPLMFAAPDRYPDAPGSGDLEAGVAHTVEPGTRDAARPRRCADCRLSIGTYYSSAIAVARRLLRRPFASASRPER
jgi:hypothetical protein